MEQLKSKIMYFLVQLNRNLKNYYNPIWDLDNGAEQLISFYKKINLKNIIKEDRITNRLRQLKYLKEKNIINNKLFFR